MTVKTVKNKRGYDWEALEMEYMDSPWLTIRELAREHDLPKSSVLQTAKNGEWLQRREARYRKIHTANLERIDNILTAKTGDDVSSFVALEDRVKRLALASLELIVPPEEAPLNAQMAARTRLEAMSAKQLSEIVNTSLRTLTETGRHRRLLMGQATALFGRADAPDVLIDEPIADAQALEIRSRLAQKALKASINGEPLDVDFAVLSSPEDAPEVSPIPPDSPVLGGL